MEKVLLAIDGMKPDRNIFRYAIELCRQIKAELNVFQIIRPKYYRKYIKEIRKKADHARIYFESSMAAVTFAEAGEHETAREMMVEASEEIKRLLSKSEKSGVHCHFAVKSGNPEKEIINYVNNHRDVVLTIYDASFEDLDKTGILPKKNNVIKNIKEKLTVPLVVANAS